MDLFCQINSVCLAFSFSRTLQFTVFSRRGMEGRGEIFLRLMVQILGGEIFLKAYDSNFRRGGDQNPS